PVLLFGWSFLEGVGAALILPAIVALVAGNFPPQRPPPARRLGVAPGPAAALILPAIVALVAGTFPPQRRPAAYGLVAAAGAVAVAVGPLIGGFCTTDFSWRWGFVGGGVIVLVILAPPREIADAPPETRPHLDLVGAVLSALGLGS